VPTKKHGGSPKNLFRGFQKPLLQSNSLATQVSRCADCRAFGTSAKVTISINLDHVHAKAESEWKMRWFDRSFPFDLSPSMFPNVVERLRGTPARLDELVRDIPTAVATRRREDTWSIQENAGHLFDLEALWMARVRDLQSGNTELTEADLTNR